jgi:hypothetical protein
MATTMSRELAAAMRSGCAVATARRWRPRKTRPCEAVAPGSCRGASRWGREDSARDARQLRSAAGAHGQRQEVSAKRALLHTAEINSAALAAEHAERGRILNAYSERHRNTAHGDFSTTTSLI